MRNIDKGPGWTGTFWEFVQLTLMPPLLQLFTEIINGWILNSSIQYVQFYPHHLSEWQVFSQERRIDLADKHELLDEWN